MANAREVLPSGTVRLQQTALLGTAHSSSNLRPFHPHCSSHPIAHSCSRAVRGNLPKCSYPFRQEVCGSRVGRTCETRGSGSDGLHTALVTFISRKKSPQAPVVWDEHKSGRRLQSTNNDILVTEHDETRQIQKIMTPSHDL